MISEDKRGFALVIILGLVLLLITAAISFMLITSSEIKAVRTQGASMRAFYLAEAGLERVRHDLLRHDSNWADNKFYYGDNSEYDYINLGDNVPDLVNFYPLSYTSTSLGGGYYNVYLKNVDEDVDEVADDDVIWVKSTGTYHGKARAIQAKLVSVGGNVTSAMEAQGAINIQGSAVINGTSQEYTTISFDDIFNMSKSDMENKADTYYSTAFNNNEAAGITWISSPGTQSQITTSGWTGNGILIVDGDLKITGGTFDGIIWVIGELSVSGNPTINGGIFVESGVTVDTTVTGNATINYDAAAINAASLVSVTSWKEASP